ncbi:MAG: hypothetical protein LUD72_02700 [Bacteroidales bacterium]|nr:hypothetical protein [Bacteroidales bacterium]
MKDLINYGKTTQSQTNTGMLTPKVEHSYKAADGKTYGILRECNKFYIKVAPAKDEGVAVLAEDYDYIDGFMNKKENEFSTYTQASKAFDLKMMDINEKHNRKQEIQVAPSAPSEWQINETKEMRAEIDRFNQINNNVHIILKEATENFTTKHTVPEAPASNPSAEKVHDPFVEPATANGDKDFKETNDNPASAAGPFTTAIKSVEKTMTSDKKPTGDEEVKAPFTETPKYAPANTVTTQNPKGGEVKAVREGRTFKLSESQVLAWNNANPDYLDTHKGTEIGSMAPFTEVVTVNDLNKEANTNTEGSTAPFTEPVKEGEEKRGEQLNEGCLKEEPWYDAAGFDDVPFPEVDDETDAMLDRWLAKQGITSQSLESNANARRAAVEDMTGIHEGRQRRGRRVNEAVLDVFGKHPAYRKRPMTTPTHRVTTPPWARDWDDESVKGDEPFGSKKGNPDPFTEIVDILTDAIVNSPNFPK